MYQKLLNYHKQPGEFAIMVMGDHGMTLNGGHGGSSEFEIMVPLIFIRPSLLVVSNKGNNTSIFTKQKQKRRNLVSNFINEFNGHLKPGTI